MIGPAWHEGHQVAFDVESTGVDAHNDRIVTASIVHLHPERRPRTLSWLIDPGIDIPEGASDIHGWTTDRVRAELTGHEARYSQNGRTVWCTREAALFAIAGQLGLAIGQGVPVIAFNASYDLTILEAEFTRHDVPTLTSRPAGVKGIVDPFVIDKHYSRRRGSRKLGDQVNHYKVILAGAHDAGADALAAARVLARQVAAYPELAGLSLAVLQTRQVKWRREQCDSLRRYFDSKGTPHDGVCPEWPLHGDCCRTEPAEVVAS